MGFSPRGIRIPVGLWTLRMHPFRLFSWPSNLFSVIVTELAAPNQPGPQALDSVSAARTHICPKFLRREATTARAHELSKEQLIVAACGSEAQKPRARTTLRPADARLRPHRCRSAAALACAAEIIDAGRPTEGFRAESSQQRCPTSAHAGGPLADETRIEGVMVDGAPLP